MSSTPDMQFGPSETTLAVLAGGAGRRMGLPKAWLFIEKEPILAWLLHRLCWPGPTLLVTAPVVSDPPAAEIFHRHVTDRVSGTGPLGGILTALEHSATLFTVVITVDMPGIDRSKLVWLLEAITARPSCDGLWCKLRSGAVEHVEPFPSVFRTTAAHSIERSLELGQFAVRDLSKEPLFSAIPAPPDWPANMWTNLNTPSDLAAFLTTHIKRDPENAS